MAKKPEKQRKLTVYLGPELEDALDKHLKKKKTDASTLVRRLLATDIGSPELADTVRMGRPKKTPDE